MTDSIGKHQCSACNRFFVGVSAFDKHRIGDFGKNRRCMTEEEMRDADLASEKKFVRLSIEGKMSLQEQDVWFLASDRERVRSAFQS